VNHVRYYSQQPCAQFGFSLIELALVLLVLGVTTWAIAGSYGNSAIAGERDLARAHGQTLLNNLRAFALNNGRLPCPDTAAIGSVNSGWETVSAAGTCAVATTETGMFPYRSLGLEMPDNQLRAAYGVYRNSAVRADLTVQAERTDIPAVASSVLDTRDFIAALNFAATASSPPSATHLYLTGDNLTLGAVNCATTVLSNQAFVLVMPLRDRNGAGNEFDGIHNAFSAGTSVCASAPSTPFSLNMDDVVVAESFAGLSGWLAPRVP
jgi:type II secretory pathway pseudopilin PulG